MNAANKIQIEMMANFMERHPDLAKSFSAKGANCRDAHRVLWERLKVSLNTNGPPTKSTAEWKRVWAIRKYNAKKKLVRNKKSLHKTGGGPFAEQPLNSQEEVIIQACGIQASVSGIQGATSFGCDEEEFEEEFLELTEVEAMQPEPQGQAEQPSDRQPTINNNRPTPNKKQDSSSSKQIELALKQVELQEQFIKIQSTKLESIDESLKDINCTLVELKECAKLLCIEKQKDRELKKEELVLKRMRS